MPGSGQSAVLKLHYTSPEMKVEERAARPFGIGSGRESPDSRLGAVCGP